MGLLEIVLKRKQKEKKKMICPNCRGSLYPLEESIEKIYICESCGKTFDYHFLIKANADAKNDELPIYTLFNKSFMQKYTNFECFDDFIHSCPIQCGNESISFDKSIPTKHPRVWNKYVKEQTTFSCWNEMFERAIELLLHL